MSIRYTPKIAFFVFLACILSTLCLASNFERDPIGETQTNPVPVTPETLKDEKAGAPAPSYRLQKHSGEFFVEKPTEKIEKEKVIPPISDELVSTQEKSDDWDSEDKADEDTVVDL